MCTIRDQTRRYYVFYNLFNLLFQCQLPFLNIYIYNIKIKLHLDITKTGFVSIDWMLDDEEKFIQNMKIELSRNKNVNNK